MLNSTKKQSEDKFGWRERAPISINLNSSSLRNYVFFFKLHLNVDHPQPLKNFNLSQLKLSFLPFQIEFFHDKFIFPSTSENFHRELIRNSRNLLESVFDEFFILKAFSMLIQHSLSSVHFNLTNLTSKDEMLKNDAKAQLKLFRSKKSSIHELHSLLLYTFIHIKFFLSFFPFQPHSKPYTQSLCVVRSYMLQKAFACFNNNQMISSSRQHKVISMPKIYPLSASYERTKTDFFCNSELFSTFLPFRFR